MTASKTSVHNTSSHGIMIDVPCKMCKIKSKIVFQSKTRNACPLSSVVEKYPSSDQPEESEQTLTTKLYAVQSCRLHLVYSPGTSIPFNDRKLFNLGIAVNSDDLRTLTKSSDKRCPGYLFLSAVHDTIFKYISVDSKKWPFYIWLVSTLFVACEQLVAR